MDPAEFLKGRTRETSIRRDAGGRWFNGEDRVEHPILARRFDGWIDRAEDGRFCLSNDVNWAYFALEGPAYFVRAAAVGEGGEGVTLQLSGDRTEILDPKTLRQDEHGALWCDVREGRCPARFDNNAAASLADIIDEDDEGVFIALDGERVRPPMVTAAQAAS